MDMPQIQINQQFARIGIKIKTPYIKVKQGNSKIGINYPQDKIEINQQNAIVNIDSYPTRYDLNIKNIMDFRKDITQKSKQTVMQSIGRMAQNGDSLMKLENGGNPVVEIIKRETFQPLRELGLKWISRPKFNVEPAKLDVKYKQNSLVLIPESSDTDIKLARGMVKINMVQYNKLDIEIRGKYIDTSN